MSVSGECVAFGRHIDGVARTRGLSHSLRRRPRRWHWARHCVVSSTCYWTYRSAVWWWSHPLCCCKDFPLFGDDLVPLTDTSGLSDDVAASWNINNCGNSRVDWFVQPGVGCKLIATLTTTKSRLKSRQIESSKGCYPSGRIATGYSAVWFTDSVWRLCDISLARAAAAVWERRD